MQEMLWQRAPKLTYVSEWLVNQVNVRYSRFLLNSCDKMNISVTRICVSVPHTFSHVNKIYVTDQSAGIENWFLGSEQSTLQQLPRSKESNFSRFMSMKCLQSCQIKSYWNIKMN